MSAFGGIPIRVETTAAARAGFALGVELGAILSELATLLEALRLTGQEGAIDLRSLPLGANELDCLRRILGRGEVDIRIDANGESRIRETAVRGLWWTEHRDAVGAPLAVLIEVARVPNILLAADEELALGAVRLRAAAAAQSSAPGETPNGTT
jgi:hydrogenase-1 operon protein HyaF